MSRDRAFRVRESWWREMTRSSGAISAMLWDLSPRDLKSVSDWAIHLLTVKEYKKRWRTKNG